MQDDNWQGATFEIARCKIEFEVMERNYHGNVASAVCVTDGDDLPAGIGPTTI